MPATAGASKSVVQCYLFKSQLQQFVQKAGYTTPLYEIVKEGPSHQPTFRSTVTVNHVRYDSLVGFFTRKAAEQSAAEVALLELNKSKSTSECNTKPVTETGLCKNLLQEYAQKMNYSMPVYRFEKSNDFGRMQTVIYSVEIGGMKYIGGAAKNKKEAEIKAARTALLAIHATTSPPHSSQVDSVHTVVPYREKAVDVGIKPQETTDALKTKKKRFKQKPRKKKKKHEGNHNGKGEDNTSPIVRSPDDKVGPGGVDGSVIEPSDPNVLAAKIVPDCSETRTPKGAGLIQNISHLGGNHHGQSKDNMIPMVCSPNDKVGLGGEGDSLMKLSDPEVLAAKIQLPECRECLTPLGADSIQNLSYLDAKHGSESKDNVFSSDMVRVGGVDSFTKQSDPEVLAGEMSSPEWAESLTPLEAGSIPDFSQLEGNHSGQSKDMARSPNDSVIKQSDPGVLDSKASSPEWAECLTPSGAGLINNFSHLDRLRFTEETVTSMRNHFGAVNLQPPYHCDGLDSLIEIANGGPNISNWSKPSHGHTKRGQL